MPILYGASTGVIFIKYNFFADPYVAPPNGLTVFYLICSYSKGILLWISAIFMGDSMRRIRNAINQVQQEVKMNQEIFYAHLVVLVLYLLSVVLYYLAFTLKTLNPGSDRLGVVTFRCWDTSTYLNVLQQLFLIGLFWSLSGEHKAK